MKKTAITLSLAAFAVALQASASGKWTLQGVEYAVDTLSHYRVGPGTTVTVVDLAGPVKQRVFYTITDLTHPDVEIKTICGKDELRSNLTVPDMVAQHADHDNVYFAGVNSDLFSATGPIGSTVVNGEVYKTAKTSTAWRAAGYDSDGAVYFGTAQAYFSARLDGKGGCSPDYVNVPRVQGESIVYTRRWGKTTGTESGETGVEVAMKPLGGGLDAGGYTEYEVLSAPEVNKGNMSIPEGGIVLSSAKSSQFDMLKAAKAGDVFRLSTSFNIKGQGYGVEHYCNGLREMSGGNPLLLEKGVILDTDDALDHLKSRRPRTALGCDATGRRMVMLVVDGDKLNSGISAGCASKDLAAMMLATGCTEAVNFDGGGSSTLYTERFGVLNRPSDGSLRRVRNGWFVTTPNTGDNEVTEIAFADPVKRINPGETYTPVIYGYNKAGLLVDTNVKGAVLSCAPALGSVSQDGASLKVGGEGLFRLEAKSGAMTASIAVYAGDWQSGITDVAPDADAHSLLSNHVSAGSNAVLSLAAPAEVAVYALSGHMMLSRRYDAAGSVELPTAALPCGVYIVKAGAQTMKLIIR